MLIIKLGIEAPCPQRRSTIRFSSVFAARQAKSMAAALNALCYSAHAREKAHGDYDVAVFIKYPGELWDAAETSRA